MPVGLARRLVRLIVASLVIALIAVTVAGAVMTRQRAIDLLTNPVDVRPTPGATPASHGLFYEDVRVTTADGLSLVGWYIPTLNGAAIIAQHGYKSHRGEMLNEAAMLHRHGYGVLVSTVRAHDASDGELISFGQREMQDLDAWYRMLLAQPNVTRVGLLGNSLGGTLAIQFAAATPGVGAVVANSAFSSLHDTIETSIRFFTGLPPFPFAPAIVFWAEREAGFSAADVDAKRWIGRISPRAVFLMQGGKDFVISPDSGQRLFDAAGEPRELWFDPELRHTRFDTARPQEYEARVVGFFDRYLLGKSVQGVQAVQGGSR